MKIQRVLFQTASALVVACLSLLASCATATPSAKSAPPGSGLAEYKQLVGDSHHALAASMTALSRVASQKAPCSGAALAKFSSAIDHLAAESVVIRARSQAMQTRGDAYFQNWQERMAEVSDSDFRVRAEQHRSELQQRFALMKEHSLQTRQEFGAFLSGLRKLRSTLERDPAAVESPSIKALVQQVGTEGLAVEKGLDAVEAELDAMVALLLPGGRGSATVTANGRQANSH